MIRFFIGVLCGVFAGYVLGRALPVGIFLSVCLALLALVIFFFWLIHLGVSDFQEY